MKKPGTCQRQVLVHAPAMTPDLIRALKSDPWPVRLGRTLRRMWVSVCARKGLLLIAMGGLLLLSGCALRGYGVELMAKDYKVDALRGQSDEQRAKDDADCQREITSTVSGKEVLLGEIATRARYQECLGVRGYRVEFKEPLYRSDGSLVK